MKAQCKFTTIILATFALVIAIIVTSSCTKDREEEPLPNKEMRIAFSIQIPITTNNHLDYHGEYEIEKLHLLIFDHKGNLEHNQYFEKSRLSIIESDGNMIYTGSFYIKQSPEKRTLCLIGNEPTSLSSAITDSSLGSINLKEFEEINITGTYGQLPTVQTDTLKGNIPFTLMQTNIILDKNNTDIQLGALSRVTARIDPITFIKEEDMDNQVEVKLLSVTLTRMKQSRLIANNPLITNENIDLESVILLDQPKGLIIEKTPTQLTEPIYLWENHNTKESCKTTLTIRWSIDGKEYYDTSILEDESGFINRNCVYQPIYTIIKEKKMARLQTKTVRKLQDEIE